MKKLFAAAASGALALGMLGGAGAVTVASAPSAEAHYCGISWGSQAKARWLYSGAHVTGVRTGQHACFDRFVVDLQHKVRGYEVHYGSIATEGEGRHIPMRGRDISITVLANAYTDSGRATYDPVDWDHVANVSGYRTFRQVAYGGSFEGHTTFGIGVRERLPMRVFILDGPGTGSRLVVDVAHRW
ncbi:hypothetical protein E7744_04325 [Citricoccus sp. SGAir0253]|uniref:AMIN-like domain-containing (lipo)protein n=1 Tax=Citricoccus sp. SGAir0253 TaxID=2567881 RepID=UPI0010CCC20B|nr:hypothetical protein [Citricoccus sp. SGAir0253]QCU77532.1 hypothetical protein E7744_04325 [Citricoccus sp. SGAir0253]